MFKGKRLWFFPILLLIALVVFAACGDDDDDDEATAAPAGETPAAAGETPAAAEEEFTIFVVVHGGIADPFWKVVERGAKDAEAQIPGLSVNYTGPEVFDLDEFLADVDTAIAAGPDALVLTLTAPDAMDEPLRRALDGGLPIVAINAPDLRLPVEDRIPVLTYVGEDSFFIGVKAAEETLARFTPTRAVFANHAPGAFNIQERGRGWIETMEAAGVPAEAIDITEDAVQGAEIMSAFLTANSDVDVMFVTNTLRTETIIPRLEDGGIVVGDGGVRIAQMDVSPQILDFIGDGRVMFTMDQQQYMQGYLGVLFAYLKLKFDLAPPPIPVSTGPAVVTADDIARLKGLAEDGFR